MVNTASDELFSTSVDDDDAREYNPDNTSTLTITAEEKVGDTSASTQEIEGDVFDPLRERLNNMKSAARNKRIDYLLYRDLFPVLHSAPLFFQIPRKS